jgi:DNA-binding LytR/AlgR family response regulator
MTKLKCIIIDDDPLITDLVAHFADKCDLIDYCVTCNDSLEGIKLLTNGTFDILFLDYNMPGLSGQDLLDLKKDESKVIMITSNTEFAVESYKYEDVLDYLVKPLNYDNFLASVQRFVNRAKSKGTSEKKASKSSIMLKDGNNWFPINFNEIKFIKSESNYCLFYTTKGKIMTLATMKELELKLPSDFIRCHRSYIINSHFISKINLDEICIGEEVIPVSSMFKDKVKLFIESNA